MTVQLNSKVHRLELLSLYVFTRKHWW